MIINGSVGCKLFPCTDVRHTGYLVPGIDLDAEKIKLIIISEAAPESPGDDYYAPGNPLFLQTTVMAFSDAGVKVTFIQELLGMGIYLTTAVKCSKTSYGIQTSTIKECSRLLEQELKQFPNVKVYLLMGDVAIKAVNEIARRAGEKRAIPTGSTYKIRGTPYYFQGKRLFPSYLQVGPSFGIEKSKRRMIAEDISAALKLL